MSRVSFPVATLAMAGALAGCGGGSEGGDTAGVGAGTVQQPKGDLIAGRDAFHIGTEPRCGDCHTLADAATTSKTGPNLDEAKPTFEEVLAAMNEGPGAMPDYSDVSGEVKTNIAAYVGVRHARERISGLRAGRGRLALPLIESHSDSLAPVRATPTAWWTGPPVAGFEVR